MLASYLLIAIFVLHFRANAQKKEKNVKLKKLQDCKSEQRFEEKEKENFRKILVNLNAAADRVW